MQQYILRVSHLLGEEIDVALGLRLFVACLVAIGGIVGRIEEVGIIRLFSLLHRRFSLRLLRCSAHVACTGTFDFGEVLLEAGDDRREVVDGEYRLLLEECVAYDRRRVTVVSRPYVMRDVAVLCKLYDCSLLWRAGCLFSFGVFGVFGVRFVTFLYVVRVELFSNSENGTREAFSWLVAGGSCICSERMDLWMRLT